MAQYFQLTKKGETEPTAFVDIDEEICEHFDVPVDPKYWYEHWYDIIGLALATGSSFDDIIEDREGYGVRIRQIAVYLSLHYVSRAWAGR